MNTDEIREKLDGISLEDSSYFRKYCDVTNLFDKVLDEIDELWRLFDLQQTRMGEATKRWRKATGKHETLPDLGDLLQWLIDEIDRLREENKTLDLHFRQLIGTSEQRIEIEQRTKKACKTAVNQEGSLCLLSADDVTAIMYAIDSVKI